MSVTKETLEKFDDYLHQKNLTFEGIICGGTAFKLLNLRTQETNDVDSLTPIPKEIKDASFEFAKSDPNLDYDWLNVRALGALKDILKFGWGAKDETTEVFKGKALTLRSLSDENLLISKMTAIIDRTEPQDRADVIAMAPNNKLFDKCAAHVLMKEKAGGGHVDHAKKALEKLRSHLGLEKDFELELELEP